MQFTNPFLGAVRLAWLAQLAALPAVGALLDARSPGVRGVAAVLLWLGWAAGLVASLVPTPLSLTVLRVLAPCAPLVVALSAFEAGTPALVAGAAAATVMTAVVFTPAVAATFVQGSAYGDETRLPLKPPGRLLLGPIPLAWALVVGGLTAGPLLLGARSWVAGAAASAVGLPVAWFCARALHRLARRWLVFVPAGVVVHDHLVLADTAMFRRTAISTVTLAEEGTEALDLTGAALGMAVELRFREDQHVVLAGTLRHRGGQPMLARSVMTAPSRPGAALAEAGLRRLPVGGAQAATPPPSTSSSAAS